MESKIRHKRNRPTDTEQTYGCGGAEWQEGRVGWIGSLGLADANYYTITLLHIEWINNEVLLNRIGNYIQEPLINHN